MELELIENDKGKVALLPKHSKEVINDAHAAAELLMNCSYNLDTTKIIISGHHLAVGFFDLKTGIAGDILQKFSTYGGYLAIIVDHSKFTSQSLKDFIRESNRFGRINFVNSLEEAVRVLTKI